MNRLWLAQYPAGIPADVDVTAFASLKDLLADSFARFAQLPAYESMGTVMTYRELDEASRAFGAWLQKVGGLRPGDRVALMLPNLLQYPIALAGALRAGMVVVNVNPLYTPRELEHQLKDSGAVAIVVLENFAHTLDQVIGATAVRAVITTQVGDRLPLFKRLLINAAVKHVKKLVPAWQLPGSFHFNDVLVAGRDETLDEVPLKPHRPGVPAIHRRHHRRGQGRDAHARQHGGQRAAGGRLGGARPARRRRDADPAAAAVPRVRPDGEPLVRAQGREDRADCQPARPAGVHQDPQAQRFTAIIGVNTLFRALLDAKGFGEVDLSHLKLAVAGGMAVQHVVAQRWKQAAGVPLVEGYGLTESAPVAIANPLDITEWSGLIGVPVPSTDATVLDDDGRPVPVGQVGEICLRGPQVMAATGTARTRPPRCSPPTAGCAPATWGSWTSAAASASPTARKT
jgi:long-chain acyl-CoA synthetase